MARKPQVNWFASKNGFYCNIGGQRHRLGDGPDDSQTDGPNYRRAVARYAELVCDPGASDGKADCTISEAMTRYKAYLTDTKKSVTASQMESVWEASGAGKVGSLRLSELRLKHIDAWLSQQASWGQTTRFHAYHILRQGLQWNVDRGHTSTNPLGGKVPAEYSSKAVRGADYALAPALVRVLLDNARGRFRDYLYALYRTGARPAELGMAVPANYVKSIGAIVHSGNPGKMMYAWKNAKKTKKDRVIYLPPDVIEVVEANISAGCRWLFPNENGEPYTKDCGGRAMARLRVKKDVGTHCLINKVEPKTVILYSMRHTFATRALSGPIPCPIKTLAELMGTSVAMIERHYGHLCTQGDYLRRTFDAIQLG
jgi:integrase